MIAAGQRQQHLVDLIDSLVIDEFLEQVNDGSSSTLRDFERTELVLRACRFGSLELVRSFVTDDDLIKCRHSSTGYSPLFIAIRGRQRTIIDYIISRHPPIDFSACLHEAIRQQDPVTVKLLLQLLTPDVLKRHHFLSALCECIHESESNIDNQVGFFLMFA
jgi:ankyrin repeat protein